MSKARIKLLTAFLLVLTIAVSCSSNTKQNQSLVLGYIGPSTGPAADYGQDIYKGVQLFEEKTLDIKIIYEDDKAEAVESVTAYRKLRDVDGVQYIVGPLGPVSTSAIYGAMNDADKKESYLLAASLCTDDFRKYENIMCTYPSLKSQVHYALDFALAQGKKKGYIVTENSPLGELFIAIAKEHAQKNGQEIIQTDAFDTAVDKTFYGLVTKVNSKKPEFVYVGSANTPANLQIIKTMKEQEVHTMILGAFDIGEGSLKDFGTVLEGVYFSGWISEEYDKTFTQEFTERFGKKPNLYSALGYELAATLFTTAKNGQVNKQKIITTFNENDFAIPDLQYKDSEVIIPLHTKQVVNGKFVVVD